MSLCSWHQTDWLQRWCWAGIWTAKGEGCTCRGWGDQHHWAQAEKVICPASPAPQWALQGEWLDLFRKARCSLMKELSPPLLPLLLLAVQGTYSYSVWAAQRVLSMALMLHSLFLGPEGQAGTKQPGVKWHLCPQAGSCKVALWSTCQAGHPCSAVPWSRVCGPGAVLWRTVHPPGVLLTFL